MYLLADINSGGYIKSLFQPAEYGRETVHRETRGMDQWAGCYEKLDQAKAAAAEQGREDVAILGLTDEGGVSHVWLRESQRELWVERLKVFKGCYGAWPIRKLND